ncbi:uncharacterized protein NP_4028A [Natronomonas pharaonis DSM 2160]|uniref:HTH domain protein n=1 Tax=Natronomonas pharaonis (strain ATCC 35678 / DSM 2160 / CIP 103997 / JCM 8858 / NBRC 14720 / NCIMB 2260 / Gabara) TaxID=348780 RepID=A0A1U7EY21_NATPD|nr:hypothetical protein [Natronomonas pharaonis]CAI50105.1 uncharacterized protein NP_4028A [Natronomonas pharaonis DSM 2160]
MNQHAMRTAMALYENGTLTAEAAARQAGVSVDRLKRAVRRAGGSTPSPTVDSGRPRVSAD